MQDTSKASSILRKLVLDDLNEEGFEVVLGEDDGLIELQKDFGADAQSNELFFIKKYAKAVVLIADSSGSFSELGLFAHFHSDDECKFSFLLIMDEFYQKNKDLYVSLGPVQIVESGGSVLYASFADSEASFTDIRSDIIKFLKARRFRSWM